MGLKRDVSFKHGGWGWELDMYLEINGRRGANGSVSPACFVHPKLVWLLHMKRQKSEVRSGIDLFEVLEFNRPCFLWVLYQ